MELKNLSGFLTLSELNVLGTATSNSSISNDVAEVFGQEENEQKFIVFTSRICDTHGCFLGSGGVSTGRTVLIEGSSSSENFQTMSLLSFPWLDDVRTWQMDL